MTFISKKNNVQLVDGQVHKHSPTALQEAAIVQQLHAAGVPVPQVISAEDCLLILELLPGQPLPDAIERGDYDPTQLAQALCDWFALFDAACPGMSRGDVNGRNFLYDGSKIYAVDFEEALQSGSLACDCGRLAAFLATYNTLHREKQAVLVHTFMQKNDYPVHAFLCELVTMKKRRTSA